MRDLLWTASAAVLALACLPAAAKAQSVGEIVVTAQKREQRLQDTPVAMTVLSADALRDNAVRDIKEMQILTPGLSVTSTTNEGQTSARIRGVGTIGDNPGLESSVGVVIDGVYRARSGVAFGELGELERVEVLKGPQGTLFGKNTSAGVINVLTPAPAFDFSAVGEVGAGNYGARSASVSVTGPLLGETLAGRIYAARRTRDGFLDIRPGDGPRTSVDDVTQDVTTLRGQLLWRPAATVEARLIADWTRRDERCCMNTPVIVGGTAGYIDALAADEGVYRPADPFARISYANRDNLQKVEDKGLSAQVDWDLGFAGLTSITAVRDWRIDTQSDQDFSSADLWWRDGATFSAFETASQELRLAGATDRVDWLVGGFWSREQLDMGFATSLGADYEPYFGLLLSGGTDPALVASYTGLPFGSNFPAGQGPRDTFDHRAESWALFTNDTWRMTEAIELTLGLRYTEEEKQVLAHYRNSVPAMACATALADPAKPVPANVLGAICAPHADPAFDFVDLPEQTKTERRWSGTLKGAWRPSPQLMAYVSYAAGFKSGGFNLDRMRKGIGVVETDLSFPAETVETYELGLRGTLLDGRLLLNATLFDQAFEDFQLNTYTGITWVTAAIPRVASRGADLDALWSPPIEGLSFTGGVTYAETQYGDFTPPPGISNRLPNARLSYAPLWSVTGGTRYERSLWEGFKLRASLSARFTSSYNTGSNLDPNKRQQAFTLVNGRIGVGPQSDRWAVELWSQNLTDVDYYQVVVDQPLQGGTYAAFLGAPRTWGVTLRASY